MFVFRSFVIVIKFTFHFLDGFLFLLFNTSFKILKNTSKFPQLNSSTIIIKGKVLQNSFEFKVFGLFLSNALRLVFRV